MIRHTLQFLGGLSDYLDSFRGDGYSKWLSEYRFYIFVCVSSLNGITQYASHKHVYMDIPWYALVLLRWIYVLICSLQPIIEEEDKEWFDVLVICLFQVPLYSNKSNLLSIFSLFYISRIPRVIEFFNCKYCPSLFVLDFLPNFSLFSIVFVVLFFFFCVVGQRVIEGVVHIAQTIKIKRTERHTTTTSFAFHCCCTFGMRARADVSIYTFVNSWRQLTSEGQTFPAYLSLYG